MRKNAENGLLGWLMMIPVMVLGALMAVTFGVCCMVWWVVKMAFRGARSV